MASLISNGHTRCLIPEIHDEGSKELLQQILPRIDTPACRNAPLIAGATSRHSGVQARRCTDISVHSCSYCVHPWLFYSLCLVSVNEILQTFPGFHNHFHVATFSDIAQTGNETRRHKTLRSIGDRDFQRRSGSHDRSFGVHS